MTTAEVTRGNADLMRAQREQIDAILREAGAVNEGEEPGELPDVEADPRVVAARANVQKVAEQRQAVAAEIAAKEAELGLKPGASARDLDSLGAKLIAAGGTDEGVESLASLRKRLKRIKDAEAIAGEAAEACIGKLRRELSKRAQEAVFNPAARRSARLLLELIVAKQDEQRARAQLKAAKFDEPNGTFGSPLLDPWSNPVLAGLVRDGWLSRDEVKAALPHLNEL